MCSLPDGPAGGHRLHASSGPGMGLSGQSVPTAAGQTLCDRRMLWPGHGLLSVRSGGEDVGVLGRLAGHPAAQSEGEPLKGLQPTVDCRLDPVNSL